jgi:hypothetical protein
MFNTEDRRNMRQLGQLHESEENRYYQILRNKLSQLYDRDNLTAEQHQEIVELETDICKLIQVEAESYARQHTHYARQYTELAYWATEYLQTNQPTNK